MDLRHLEYFVAVADTGSFTRAAERCRAAQSTVSAGIRALEREVGAPLFVRDTRRVQPTPGGLAALPIARRMLEAGSALAGAAVGDGRLRGLVRIGILTNVLVRDPLPRVLGRFRQAHPAVELILSPSPSGSSGLAAELDGGRIDLAFLGVGSARARSFGRFRVEVLARSDMVAVLPVGHPLTKGGPVALAALAGEPFIDSPEGFGNRVALDEALAEEGLVRRTTIEIADVSQVSSFVAAGLGVAVLPAYIASPAEGAVLRPLDRAIGWELAMAARPDAPPAAIALMRELVDTVRSADRAPLG